MMTFQDLQNFFISAQSSSGNVNKAKASTIFENDGGNVTVNGLDVNGITATVSLGAEGD